MLPSPWRPPRPIAWCAWPICSNGQRPRRRRGSTAAGADAVGRQRRCLNGRWMPVGALELASGGPSGSGGRPSRSSPWSRHRSRPSHPPRRRRSTWESSPRLDARTRSPGSAYLRRCPKSACRTRGRRRSMPSVLRCRSSAAESPNGRTPFGRWNPAAPSDSQNAPRSALETTAIGTPPAWATSLNRLRAEST